MIMKIEKTEEKGNFKVLNKRYSICKKEIHITHPFIKTIIEVFKDRNK